MSPRGRFFTAFSTASETGRVTSNVFWRNRPGTFWFAFAQRRTVHRPHLKTGMRHFQLALRPTAEQCPDVFTRCSGRQCRPGRNLLPFA
ncbi:hypothetical protein KCP74_11520 [Salmonella enterica subsp. enterica]|nr:hypothetical protein KCP74_11520 [Salmonella enterica subsp. enterica]